MLRFSLLALAGFVTFVALGCAALINAASWISSAVWTAMLLLLMFGTVTAVFAVSTRRAFWAGFALVGWMFMLVTFGPVFGSLRNSLATTLLLQRAANAMPRATQIAFYTPEGFLVSQEVLTMNGNPPQSGWTGDGADHDVPSSESQRSGITFNIPSMSGPVIPVTTRTTQVQDTQYIESFVLIGQALCTLILAVCGGLLARALAARQQRQVSVAR